MWMIDLHWYNWLAIGYFFGIGLTLGYHSVGWFLMVFGAWMIKRKGGRG
jgi:hypothetical protein